METKKQSSGIVGLIVTAVWALFQMVRSHFGFIPFNGAESLAVDGDLSGLDALIAREQYAHDGMLRLGKVDSQECKGY